MPLNYQNAFVQQPMYSGQSNISSTPITISYNGASSNITNSTTANRYKNRYKNYSVGWANNNKQTTKRPKAKPIDKIQQRINICSWINWKRIFVSIEEYTAKRQNLMQSYDKDTYSKNIRSKITYIDDALMAYISEKEKRIKELLIKC